MFDWLVGLVSGSLVAYPVVIVVVALDAVLPVMPGETAVIAAGVLAADGALLVVAVLLAAWGGALLGDNVSYGLGARFQRPLRRRLFAGDRSRRMLSWARRALDERGWQMIVAARFIPGGRTAVTFAAGMVGHRWRRFIAADLAGTLLWAVYATALGYVGGETFQRSLWKPLLVALAVAGAVTAAGELARHLTDRSGSRGS